MLDIEIGRRHARQCNGLVRRDFLRVGGLGALGLSLSGWLRAAASAAKEKNRTPARAKAVVLVYLGGGMSHHDSFDLKPDAPAEIWGKYKPISTNVTGTYISEMLPY